MQTSPFSSETTPVTRCPVCNTTFQSKNSEEKLPNIYTISSNIGEKVLQYSYQVSQCSECNLFYKNNIPGYEMLNKYYENLDTGYENTQTEFPTDKKVLEIINANRETASKILDYGCGSGRLLSRLPGHIEKFGIEINPEAVAAAKKRNISIISDEELETVYKEQFDFIILTDVYEHLYRPLELVTKLVGSLAENGQLIIVTGDTGGVKFKKHIGGYWYFKLFSHLQMLNEEHVAWLAKRMNLRPVVLVKTSHYDSPAGNKIKHFIAASMFFCYQSSRKWLPFLWKLPQLNKVRNWSYPLYDTVNKDHLIISLKK